MLLPEPKLPRCRERISLDDLKEAVRIWLSLSLMNASSVFCGTTLPVQLPEVPHDPLFTSHVRGVPYAGAATSGERAKEAAANAFVINLRLEDTVMIYSSRKAREGGEANWLPQIKIVMSGCGTGVEKQLPEWLAMDTCQFPANAIVKKWQLTTGNDSI